MSDTAAAPARIGVRKTYKLYIGGAFPRSESGRSYLVTDHKERFLANASLASRKDARDAVAAARKAFAGWSAATAYNRGQVLYRVAEMLEGRRAQFIAEVRAAEGLGARQAEAVVDATIDRWVWYAGWADKLAQVRGAANPVAGPYFNFSLPEPTGVVAVIAPQASSLLGFVSVVAPAVVSGNTVVALASERCPLPAVSLSEVLATSDVPGGVINVLTGRTAEIAPWLASHMDVNALDPCGASGSLADDLAVAAAENLKRVVRAGDEDWTLTPGLDRMLTYLETKTVWHPAAPRRNLGIRGQARSRGGTWRTMRWVGRGVYPSGGSMPTTVQPVIVTPSIPLLLAFYKALLGAVEISRVPEDGPAFYVALQIGNAEVGVVADGDAYTDAPQRILLNVNVADLGVGRVAGLLEHVEALGGRVLGPPNDMPWGQRVAHIQDPDGNTINLTEPI